MKTVREIAETCTPMSPIKFKLYPTYGSRADVIWKISRWLLWWPSWISEQNHFSNSRFPCCPDAFHQVSAPCDTIREQMTIEDFQDGLHGSHHGYCNKLILATLNLHVTQMPSAKFWLNLTYHSGADLKIFKMAAMVAILDIRTEPF